MKLEELRENSLEDGNPTSVPSDSFSEVSVMEEIKRLNKQVEEGLLPALAGLREAVYQANLEVVRKGEEGRRLKRRILKLTQSQSRIQTQVGTGEEGGLNPMLIFPEEVWEIILTNVEGPEDRWSCSKTCTLFDSLLHKSKGEWLFPRIFPHLYKFLSRSLILDCRLVCKVWNFGVDNLFESHSALQPYNKESHLPQSPPFIPPSREKQIGLRVHGRMRFHPKNPFIGRSLQFNEDPCSRSQLIRNALRLEEFLRLTGVHLWHIQQISSWPNHDLDFPLHKLLQLAPNLRSLRLTTKFAGRRRNLLPTLLPPAPFLNTLVLNEVEYFEDDPFIKLLLQRYHLQLGRLHLGWPAWVNLGHSLPWPNLAELHLDRVRPSEMAPLMEEIRAPNLSKLGLALETDDQENSDPFPALLWLLHKLEGISVLRLSGVVWKPAGMVGTSLFAPPTFKTLEVQNSSSPKATNYIFLVHFPFLQNLNIYWQEQGSAWNRNDISYAAGNPSQPPSLLEDEVVQFHRYAYQGRLYESNIWRVLPRVKNLTFQGRLYTRYGYEKWVKHWAGLNLGEKEPNSF